MQNCKATFRVLNSPPPSLYGDVSFSGPPPPSLGSQLWTDHVMPMLHARHEVSGRPNKRGWEQFLDIWLTLLEFGLINSPLLIVTGRW